jgi:hypothetical protein
VAEKSPEKSIDKNSREMACDTQKNEEKRALDGDKNEDLGNVESVKDQYMMVVLGQGHHIALACNLQAATAGHLHKMFRFLSERFNTMVGKNVASKKIRVSQRVRR